MIEIPGDGFWNKMRMLPLLLLVSIQAHAGEEPGGEVKIVDCDGRQIVVVVPQGSKFDLPQDPCMLTGKKEERPSSFICVGGTCFPRSFIVTHPPAKP